MTVKIKKVITISVASLFGLIVIFSMVKRVTPLSWAMHNDISQPKFSNEALDGYDVVAYFLKNKAVEGNQTISYQWKNATWQFSSEENRNLFAASPEKYEPAFGGYCAFAVSKGFTAKTEASSFKIVNEKLYLFSDNDIRTDWLSNRSINLMSATNNWKQ